MSQRAYLILTLLVIVAGLVIGWGDPVIVVFLVTMTALLAVGLISENTTREEERA